MSDEYANSGFEGSLVDKSAEDTKNYPPQGDDSTSSGGSGSAQDAWSTSAQRGRTEQLADTGLVDQSLSGGDLKGEIQDASQGVDNGTRSDMQAAGKRGEDVDPYRGSGLDSREEAERKLKEAYA